MQQKQIVDLLAEYNALKKELRQSLETVGDVDGHVNAHVVYYRVHAARKKMCRLFAKHNMMIARSGCFPAEHDY
jgi:hypothetical protein